MEFSLEPKTIIDIVMFLGMGIGGFIYRLHVKRYEEHRHENAKKIEALEKADEVSEEKLDKLRTEGESVMERKFNELRQDLYGRLLEESNHRKEVFEALKKSSDDFWNANNLLRSDVHKLETNILREYHTKEELVRLFDDKLNPMLKMIEGLGTQMAQIAKRRPTDV